MLQLCPPVSLPVVILRRQKVGFVCKVREMTLFQGFKEILTEELSGLLGRLRSYCKEEADFIFPLDFKGVLICYVFSRHNLLFYNTVK